MVFADTSDVTASVKNALRHLKHLGECFRENTFSEKNVNSVDNVADTLLQLEQELIKLYSEYEAQSIGASALRHRLKILPDEYKLEITSAVNCARESNTSVIHRLQNELDALLKQLKEHNERDASLNTEIVVLQAEKNALQQRYDETIALVNQRMSDKAKLQINLNETRDTVRETNQYTYDLEEDIMALKEKLIQERNNARQEKSRLEEDIASTVKRNDQQERINRTLKKDVDVANQKKSESEMQLRTMYREREKYETENEQFTKKILEQEELLQLEQDECNRLLKEGLQLTHSAGEALLNYETKKQEYEERAQTAGDRVTEETEALKNLKVRHDEVIKQTEENIELSKTVQDEIESNGKELEELKREIANKLEKTAKLNLDNAETSKELEAMREAHQMVVDSLKLQTDGVEKQLNHLRSIRIAKQKEREQLLKNIEQMRSTTKNSIIQYNRFILQTTTKVNELSEKKTILDRDLREEQLQVNDFDDKLKTLKTEYSDMKVRFEQAIQQLEESTSQLILSIDKNRKRVQETQPGYNLLCEEFEKVTSIYEATKESMIETKRKKQEFVDK
ncbi:unnamed protein product, partial [Didymodactylos carnosus]